MISLYSYLTSTFQKCHRRNYLCKYRSSNYRSSIQPLQIVGRALSLQIAKHHKMIFRCTDIIFFPYTKEMCLWNDTKEILVGEVRSKIPNAMDRNSSVDNCW